jgi:flagellar assembly protein FliH
MTALPARFTFDLDLAHRPAGTGFLSDGARLELEQQARAKGYAEGLAAGEATATAAATQALARAAEHLVQQATAVLAGLDAARRATEREAIVLAAAVGRKLAANLVAAQPTAELEALLAECLASLSGAPHLVIRCHPDLADRMRERAAPLIAQSGFAGRLVVIGEPEIGPADGRIEWADGGLVRDQNTILAEIDKAIAAYLEARRPAIEPEETAP